MNNFDLISERINLKEVPSIMYYPDLDYISPSSGRMIKALFYSGLDYIGQSTRAFAYFGIPANASPSNPVPAVVLVHGGLGTAFGEWVDKWVDIGYAAIAMDTDGDIPDSPGSWSYSHDESGQAGPCRDDSFASIGQPLETHWMYYAVSKVIFANSLLRANSSIDKDRIGLTGISWGGLISSITLCFDSRFAFAVPVYGCGYLHESHANFKTIMTQGKVASTWDPSNYFQNIKTPILWLNSDHDPHFSIDGSSKSALATNGILTILPDMDHNYTEGWNPKEIYRFADSIVNGGTGLIIVTGQPHTGMGRDVTVKYSVPAELSIKSAFLYYTDSDITYSDDFTCLTQWKSLDIVLDKDSSAIMVNIPANAKVYYINITGWDGTNEYTTSTYIVKLEDTPGRLLFFGSESAELFTKEVEESFKGVLEKNFKYMPGEGIEGFVTASIDDRPWNDTMWTRDAGVFLRELVQWGYLKHACLLTKCLITLVKKSDKGFFTFPEYFKFGIPGSGSELDGTAAIIIGMILLWERLAKDNPLKEKIYNFLSNETSPIKHIINILKDEPLIPGSGEFGGGCCIEGDYYNVVQNNLIRLALLKAEKMEKVVGNEETANLYKHCAGVIDENMRKHLIDSDETWIWCISPATMKADPEILGSEYNMGFGGINGVISMFSDVLGFEPLISGWRGIDQCIKTFEKLGKTPLRKEQFEKYGIWTQFDILREGYLTSCSYGQGYVLQLMLLLDKMDMAEKGLDFLAQKTCNPPEGYKLDRDNCYYFYEGMYSPDAVGKFELLQGSGALNLVNVVEPLKVARLIAGVDDTSNEVVKIIPRVPKSWKGFEARKWPIKAGDSVVIGNINYLYEAGRIIFKLEIEEGEKIPNLEIRFKIKGEIERYQFKNISKLELELAE